MSSIEDARGEQRRFEMWEAMRKLGLEDLHLALYSKDEDRRFIAAQELQLRGERATFDFVKGLAASREASQREIAAFTMGQLGTPNHPYLVESAPILAELLVMDSDPKVRAAAAAALGHLRADDGFDQLCQATRDQSSDVRSNAAFALGEFAHRKEAIPHLLSLTKDIDSEVVVWAILGLRSLGIDCAEVRRRLVEMLDDPRVDVLDEVICSLAQLKDKRALPKLLVQLERNEVNLDLISAASELGDKAALPKLMELRNEWGDATPKCLLDAISSVSADC
ncbi:HEAT repeat domain-containing protein [Ralstonia pseudosolanacearum]|uniref:HEAT repeat domain-containing protein n=1 Tax=Ralstonia pseudosolanacearum TaxID=1310165 RepID=UPI000AAAFF07|nr:HEAT repeat domain-containing protein [Ralstonia pseudosolanacearum]MCL1620316.1 HEAT repeat domain-containing protein [Ralstonia pseudosolanacearum CaRs-Mep]